MPISTRCATTPPAAFSTSTRFLPRCPSLASARSSLSARAASLAAASTLSRVAFCAAPARSDVDEDAGRTEELEREDEVGDELEGGEAVAVAVARKPDWRRAASEARAELTVFMASRARSAGGRSSSL